jgi:4-phytase / acid phosphatase
MKFSRRMVREVGVGSRSCLIVSLCLMACLRGLAQTGTREDVPGHKGEELVYALYVTRHGVRSPTSAVSQYDRFSSAPWPSWSVPPGYLTRHGYELMKLQGAFDREALAGEGLLPRQGCEEANHVSLHADSDERTRETAKALAEGLYPGCTLRVSAREEGTNDPLFHFGGATQKEAALSAAAMLGRVGDDPQAVAQAYHAPLAQLDGLLARCGSREEREGRTSILTLPASVGASEGGHLAAMRGPLNTASTLTEILLLEYAEGMPAKDVGWGCVDGGRVRELIDLHTAASELTQRTPAIAALQAGELLRAIAHSVEQAASGHAVPGAEGSPGDKVLMLVGHDTNLSNLAGALRLDWLEDGRRNDTPPGSSLVFEVWKNSVSGTLSVKTYFMAQTLEQMRNGSALSANEPMPRVPVFLPGCAQSDGTCAVPAFAQALEAAAASGAKQGSDGRK